MGQGKIDFVLKLSVLFLILLVGSCEKADLLRNPLEQTPHEAYSESLAEAGLDKSEIGRRWLSQSESALDDSLVIQLPYEEIGWLAPEEVQAFAWQFSARKGQRLVVQLETPPENNGAIFLDLFIVSDGSVEHLISLDKGERRLDRLIETDANYLLRLQPELLTAGRYELTITSEPSLTFPVEGKDSDAIGSFFGDPRDSGHREHHGVDIFAPRGTTVVAAANGVVYRTGDTSIGGKVVWLADENLSRTYYYAHLDDIAVRQGTFVEAGDPLGSVGNTGNARYTPPHLHFGIYESFGGPTDPFHFIHKSDASTEQTQVADGELQGVFSVTANLLRLREGPGTGTSISAELKRHTIVRAVAKTGDWYRVNLANGLRGYVSARYVVAVERPVDEIQLSKSQPVRVKPEESSPEVGRIKVGEKAKLYGRLDDFRYVKLPSGYFGWVALDRG